MTTSIRSEPTRSVLQVNGVDQVAFQTTGKVQILNPGTNPVSSDIPTFGTQIQSAAAQTASGTSIDFTGIPSWAKRVTMMFAGVSTNGTSLPIVQVGAGSFQTSGYVGAASGLVGGTASTSYSTGALVVNNSTAAMTHSGALRFTKLSGNVWVIDGVFGRGDSAATSVSAGTVSLSAALDRVRLTTVNGTDLYDAGTVSVMWE